MVDVRDRYQIPWGFVILNGLLGDLFLNDFGFNGGQLRDGFNHRLVATCVAQLFRSGVVRIVDDKFGDLGQSSWAE